MKEYLGTAEAAKRLGISSRRVRALVKQGRIKAMAHGDDNRKDRTQPKMWLITIADLEEFAAKPRSSGGAGVKDLKSA